MIRTRLLAFAMVALLPLSACKKAEPEKTSQAGGEVLPGSVSDAMLPLDTVTSQPPLAPRIVPSAGVKAKPEEASSEAGDATPADVPAAKPPAEPEPDQGN